MRNSLPRWSVTISLLLILLAGCDQEELFSSMVPEDEANFAKQHIDLIRSGDLDAVIAQLDRKIVTNDTRSQIEQLADLLPHEASTDIQTVGSHVTTGPQGRSAALTFQYEFADAWYLVAVWLRRSAGELLVTGVNVQPLEVPLQEMNAFGIDRRGVLGYLFMFCMVVVPLFCIAAFVTCLRTPIPKRKWLWALFTLLGFGTVSMNWTTGEVGYSILSIQLLGAGFAKAGLYAPWVVSFAAPLGAIVFLTRRSEWLAAVPAERARADALEASARSSGRVAANYTIRRASPGDASAVTTIGAALFRQAYDGAIPDAETEAYVAANFAEARQRAELSDADIVTLLAEDAGRPVAFAQLRRGNVPVESTIGADFELWRIYVDRAYHGSGLARLLLSEGLEAAVALSAHGVWLSVWEKNPRALSFYRKAGFQTVGYHNFSVGGSDYRDAVMCMAVDSFDRSGFISS